MVRFAVQQMPNPKANKEGEGRQGKNIPQMVRGRLVLFGLNFGLEFPQHQGPHRLSTGGAAVGMRAHLLRTGGAGDQDRVEPGVIWRNRGRVRGAFATYAPHHAAHAYHVLGTAFGAVHDDSALVKVNFIASLVLFLHQSLLPQEIFCALPALQAGLCQRLHSSSRRSFRSRMDVSIHGGEAHSLDEKIEGEINDGRPQKALHNFRHRVHAIRASRAGRRRSPQWLAARGTTDGLRTHLMRTDRAFCQRWSRGVGFGRGFWSSGRGFGSGKGMQTILTPGSAVRLHDLHRVAFWTVHGSLAKVSQLCRAWPRSFSDGAPERGSATRSNRLYPSRLNSFQPPSGWPHCCGSQSRAPKKWASGAHGVMRPTLYGPRFDSSFRILPSSFTF
jgi:hypothetical protein